MAENSKIEWTDHTFNPWIGCTKVSPACANCYAMTLMEARYGRVKWGKGQPRSRTAESNWRKPLQWNRSTVYRCQSCGQDYYTTLQYDFGYQCNCSSDPTICTPRRPRVFCASLADWLDDEVPIEWLVDLLQLIHDTPNLDWLLLTKRPENWPGRIAAANKHVADSAERIMPRLNGFLERWRQGTAPANVWIGTTVEDQTRADQRIPVLLQIPAKVRFLFCEPLLGPVNLGRIRLSSSFPIEHNPLTGFSYVQGKEEPWAVPTDERPAARIHWVICGGESGPHARPMHPDWARSLRDQCAAAGVPFLFKQWGEYCPAEGRPEALEHVHRWPDGTAMVKPGKKKAGRLLDAVEHNGFPTP